MYAIVSYKTRWRIISKKVRFEQVIKELQIKLQKFTLM